MGFMGPQSQIRKHGLELFTMIVIHPAIAKLQILMDGLLINDEGDADLL